MTEFTDEEEVDLDCVPSTSTAEKDYCRKHESPNSASRHLGKFAFFTCPVCCDRSRVRSTCSKVGCN